MRRIKCFYLVASLFVFLTVLLGGSLHLSPVGAVVAAAAGTPLFIHVWNSCFGISVSGARAPLGEQQVPQQPEHGNHERAARASGQPHSAVNSQPSFRVLLKPIKK